MDIWNTSALIALAKAMARAANIKHQASSIATTFNKNSVNNPLARYSLIIKTVAAGAVAEAAAPSTIAG
ncbi:hypothetical protein ES705_06594 [subsurface metagenome]